MAKGKKTRQAKSKTITLKMAQNCVELTLDGKRRLDLSFKEISSVPKCLEQLPETIGRLQNLLVLNLCNNRLKTLPNELGLLRKLHTLNLGLNRLEALPSSVAALKELRHIGLSDNQFTRVPVCLSRLNKLEKVNLDRNPLLTEHPLNQQSDMMTDRFYIVKESILCDDCLIKCQIERKKLEDVVTRKEPKLLGLPHSVTQEDREMSKSMVMGEVSRGPCRPASPSLQEGALKAGWLKKQRSIMKNWQLRWFVLRSDQLFFYKDEEETKPQGCITLQGCQVNELTANPDEPGRHLFEIVP
eukprot:superscaffoldBa00000649_g6299